MNFCFSLSVAASDFLKKVTFVQLFPQPGPDDPNMLHNSQYMLNNQQGILCTHQHNLHNHTTIWKNDKTNNPFISFDFDSSTSLAVSEDTFLLLGVPMNHYIAKLSNNKWFRGTPRSKNVCSNTASDVRVKIRWKICLYTFYQINKWKIYLLF